MCICDTLAPILTSRVRTDRGAILLEIESAPLLSEEDPGTGSEPPAILLWMGSEPVYF